MEEITVEAPAKVNLSLDILGKRPDGYHDMELVMQSISLYDTVTVQVHTGSCAIGVHCGHAAVPEGPENLACRAAAAFFQTTGVANDGVEITIEKRIPVCAGMAGGSSDAAAVLRGLRKQLRPQLSGAALEEIGAQVGSDVPFCVRGGTALARGRGTELTDLPDLPPCWIVVCKPEFGLSTPELFGRVRLEAIQRHPNLRGMQEALAHGDLQAVAAQMGNVFQEVLTAREAESIQGIQSTLKFHGAWNAIMTGSGPTVFGIFDAEASAREAVDRLQPRYAQTYLTRPIGKLPDESRPIR